MPTIDDLPAAGTLTGTETLVLTQNGKTYKGTLAGLLGVLNGTVKGIDLSQQVAKATGATTASSLAALFAGDGTTLGINASGVLGIKGATAAAGQPGGVVVTDPSNNISAQKVLATGASTARTFAARFADWANVLDEGAVADGTTDNTTPFNNAANRNAVYVVPAGDYYVSYVPSPGTTTGTAISFGANVSGAGYLGSVDESATGGSNRNANGLAVIRGYGDDWNQHVVVVQGRMFDQSGTTSTQKNGVYSVVQNDQVSDAAGGVTKDAVGVAGFANVGPSNTEGRVWGGNFVAYCPSGADGYLIGIEIDINNNSGQVGSYGAVNAKTGISLVNSGSTNSSIGILIGTGFEYGIIIDAPVGPIMNVLNIPGGGIFYVDNGGRLTATSVAVGTSNATTWTSGAGAPTTTQPKGSMYSRTDGAVGSTLYVSQGAGTWNPVAGV